MNTLALILLIVLINLAALSGLMKHRRNVRHHRRSTPLLGSSPLITVGLLKRLSESQSPDWRNPSTMQRKVAAWTQANTNNHPES